MPKVKKEVIDEPMQYADIPHMQPDQVYMEDHIMTNVS
jgi:hypothetical protein